MIRVNFPPCRRLRERFDHLPFPCAPLSACSHIGIILLILTIPSRHARAQLTNFWPETARLLAPESGFRGFPAGALLPIAGWNSTTSGRPGLPPQSAIADPLLWLGGELPLVNYSGSGTILYRDRFKGDRLTDLGGRHNNLALAVPVGGKQWSLLTGGWSEAVVTRGELTDGSAELDRGVTGRHIWIGGRMRLPGLSGIAAVGYREGRDEPVEYALAVGGEAGRALAFSLFGSREAIADELDLSYRGEEAHLSSPAWRSVVGIRLEAFLHRWSIRFRGDASHIAGRGNAEPLHRFIPELKPRSVELRIMSPGEAWQLAAGAERSRHSAEITSHGLRYARFLFDDRRTWLRIAHHLPGSGGAWWIWGGYTDTAWDAKGELEFWPFTSTIVDLLGLRRRAIADAGVSAVSSGVRYRMERRGATGIEFGIDLHNLWMDGILESWEPLILGLGKWNILTDELRYSSAQILDLGIRGEVALTGRVALTVGAAQLIPLAVQKRVRVAEAVPAEPGAPEAEAEWGGLRWWFTIRIAPAGGDRHRIR
jgi:hypothetical protein